MIVWGGNDGSAAFEHRWEIQSQIRTVGQLLVPRMRLLARSDHTAVWTGMK